MGVYKVNPDGRAPKGLGVGDWVVTEGGTYLITGFTPDGGYTSRLLKQEWTTKNFVGTYDTLPYADNNSGNANVNSGSGSGYGGNMNISGNISGNISSSGGYQGAELPSVDALSFEQAMKLAQEVMSPQYKAAQEAAVAEAAQNLERAGLYDTVYGQSLSAASRSAVAADVNSAIIGLALELSQASQEQARDILELTVKEKQFAAEHDAQQKSQAMEYLLKLMQ